MQTIILLGIAIIMAALLPLLVIWWFFHEEVNAIRMAWHCAGKEISCLRCRDCCRKNVLISHRELRRLEGFTGRKGDSFAIRMPWHWLLRKNAAGFCEFMQLDKNSAGEDISVCSVYAVRPDACRRFPNLKYFGLRGLDSRCRMVKSLCQEQKK